MSLVFLVLLTWGLISAQTLHPNDQAGLTAIFNSISGFHPSWNRARISSACSGWNGIACDGSGYITYLLLSDARKVGTIPTEINRFTRLTFLHFGYGNLVGTLPSEIGDLGATLRYFWLLNQDLIGSMPTSIGRLTRVNTFVLGQCDLTGTLPTQVGQMTSLTWLYLHGNDFTGQIPAQLFQIRTLGQVQLGANEFRGTLPRPGNLPEFHYIDINSNRVSGTIPADWFLLPQLESAHMCCNNFDGTIPSQISSSFNAINLAGNELSGFIPTTLANSLHLQYLYLHSNELTGSIPPQLGALVDLKHLYLSNNDITGTMPTNLGSMTQLAHFFLTGNFVEGTIPNYARWTQMEHLSYANNRFTGTIPSFATYNQLNAIYLFTNNLEGTIPARIFQLPELETIHFASNQLNGTLPELRGREIDRIYLNGNRLSGTLPASWMSGVMQDLQLAGNNFEGTIPQTVANMDELETLFLHGNNFSGTIPTGLCDLREINRIYISNNRFTGTVPACLKDLRQLTQFVARNNFFTGTFPDTAGGYQNLLTVDLANNFFTGQPPEFPNAVGLISNTQRGFNSTCCCSDRCACNNISGFCTRILVVKFGEHFKANESMTYDRVTVQPGGILTVNQGVHFTVVAGLLVDDEGTLNLEKNSNLTAGELINNGTVNSKTIMPLRIGCLMNEEKSSRFWLDKPVVKHYRTAGNVWVYSTRFGCTSDASQLKWSGCYVPTIVRTDAGYELYLENCNNTGYIIGGVLLGCLFLIMLLAIIYLATSAPAGGEGGSDYGYVQA